MLIAIYYTGHFFYYCFTDSFNLFFSGISLTIVGLICKSADWMKGWEKGTAVFHLLTAASFYVFWIWTQSVSNILH